MAIVPACMGSPSSQGQDSFPDFWMRCSDVLRLNMLIMQIPSGNFNIAIEHCHL